MGSKQLQSVPLQPLPLPAQLLINGARLDGRGYEEFRQPFFQAGVLTRARGSAYAELGSTKVMAAIYGPRPSERKFGFTDTGRLNCDVGFTAFATPHRTRQAQRAAEKDLASSLTAALSASLDLAKIPKSVVDCYVFVLEAGGAELAVAITAASLACADAGLEMFDLVPACSVCLCEDELLLDPSKTEEARQQGSLLLAMMPASNEITQTQLTGSWTASRCKEAVELAMGGCSQIKAALREVLLERAQTKQEALEAAAAAAAAAGGRGGM